MLSLKVKIKLNVDQKIKLETLSNEHRLLYNSDYKLLQSISTQTSDSFSKNSIS